MANLEKQRKSRKPLGKGGNCRKETLEKQEENAGKGWKKGMAWRKGKALKKLGT